MKPAKRRYYQRRYPAGVVSLQCLKAGNWRTLVGPDSTFSATGPLVDDLGNPTTNPVQSRGLAAMGAWANIAAATMAKSSATTLTDGWYDFSADIDGSESVYTSYIGSLGADASKPFTGFMTAEFKTIDVGKKIKYRIKRITGSLASFDAEHTIVAGINALAPITFTQAADSYSARFAIVRETDAGYATKIKPLKWQITQSAYAYPYAPPGVTVPASSSTTGDNGTNTALDARTSAALSLAAFTAIASIIPGASSAQVTADANVLSVRGTVADLIYLAASGTIKASDGTNVATVTVTDGWLATDRLNIFVQPTAAGNQWKIGYTKNSDATITWGSLATYKGTITPGTHQRYALNGTLPMHFRLTNISGKILTESQCLKSLRYVK